jgi:hypothetical protein
MIFEVEMHASAEGAVRSVDVPNSAMDALLAGDTGDSTERERVRQALDTIVHYGRNDVQACAGFPSVGVGDVIRLQGRRWAVLPEGDGFQVIAPEFTVPHDSGLWAYRLAGTSPVQPREQGETQP